jgi:lipopolysaccharide transport system permease protein
MQSKYKEEEWDLIIVPKSRFFDLKLKELWSYRDLLFLFVKRDFVAQYKQTILGPLWHFIQPIFTTVIFMIIFGKIADIPTDGVPHTLFYLSGITIWNYFTSCLTATSNTFVANAGIFGKVYFPRLIIPLSIILSNLVRFGIQFALFLSALLYYGVATGVLYIGSGVIILPLLLTMMAAMGLGLGLIISSLTTKYRDFTVLISFAVQLLMYCTPIVYPLSFLRNTSYPWIADWNPLTSIVEAFRYAFFGEGTFTSLSLLYSSGFISFVLILGIILFSRVERTFMDTV